MDLSILRSRIEALREKGRAFTNASSLTNAIRNDKEFNDEIRAVYLAVYKRPLSGCINCITDAFFELINNPNIMEKAKLRYKLRAGSLLYDVVNLDSGKAMSNANISNELAIYHLATNPSCIDEFVALPENWQHEVQAYLAAQQEQQPAEAAQQHEPTAPKAKTTRAAKPKSKPQTKQD